MAAIAAFPSLYSSICRSKSHGIRLQGRNNVAANGCHCLTMKKKKFPEIITRIKAVAEETLIPENGEAPVADQPVSVPVSPSDMLTMFFQAEGTMSESVVPTVSKALEEVEGVSDIKVQVLEGIASVELTKQTTVQATGVASNLVEIIQGSGFKLQTLNLSFADEEDTAN